MVEKYSLGDQIVCIKEYLSYKVEKSYTIKGSGNLRYNADPKVGGRTGWGVCVSDSSDNWTYLNLQD